MNFPKFILRLSLSNTKASATDTRQIPSSLVLCVFRMDKRVKCAWCIWEQSQVLTQLAVENEHFCVELVAGLMGTSSQILATWLIKSRPWTFKDFTSFKMFSKHSTSNVLSWKPSVVGHTSTSPLKCVNKSFISFATSSPFVALIRKLPNSG